MKKKKLKILLSIFALNSITLYFYYPDHFRHISPENHFYPPEKWFSSPDNHHNSHSKPWPILPSYLPWSQNPNVAWRSCEGYFGNGFTQRIDLLKSSLETHRKFGESRLFSGSGGGGGGWFRCFFSETLQSSICEGGGIRMNFEKIVMSKGGEKLEEVIGRGEEEELPVFESGAFEIEVNERSKIGKKLADEKFLNRYLPEGSISKHTMRELIDSIRLVGANEFHCSKWIEEPSLLITRFEYANLFHTITDWYSAHPELLACPTQLGETWRALFSSLTYAKKFSGPICFRHAILSPLGYETALFKGLSENIDCNGASSHDLWQNPNDRKTARLSEFGEMIRAAFGFPVDRQNIPKNTGPNVLFVRCEDYLAHPRHGGKVQSRLSNEQQVFDSIKSWALNHTGCKLNVVSGLFTHMSMKEQVRAIQDASVIVGAHGAGLTHIVSAAPKAVILEIISSKYRRPHFALIAQWKGLEYHPIYLEGSYADPLVVIGKLSSILKSLGC
ncbi:unnamed protein product [Withania somnifera]